MRDIPTRGSAKVGRRSAIVWSRLEAGASTILAFVLPRYPAEVLAPLRLAHELELSVVTVTRALTPAEEHSDVVLHAPVALQRVFDSYAAPMCSRWCFFRLFATQMPAQAHDRLEAFERSATRAADLYRISRKRRCQGSVPTCRCPQRRNCCCDRRDGEATYLRRGRRRACASRRSRRCSGARNASPRRAHSRRLHRRGPCRLRADHCFGSLSKVRIPNDQLVELQHNLLPSHAVGVGESLPAEVVRAMMCFFPRAGEEALWRAHRTRGADRGDAQPGRDSCRSFAWVGRRER